MPIGEENFNNPIFTKKDFSGISEKNLFIHIGQFLINPNEEHKNNLIAFVEAFGLKLIKSKASLDQSINFVYLTRCSIMDLLEQELLQNRISIRSFFEVLKNIEYSYQLISKTLLNIYKEELLFIKLALDESKEDLKMTLRERADLERVLNEATIFAITDREDKILYANDNFCDLYKYTRENYSGKNMMYTLLTFILLHFFMKYGRRYKGERFGKGIFLIKRRMGHNIG